MLSRIKKNYFLLITTFLILYFFFNFLEGERGFFSYIKKNKILNTLENKEINLMKNIKDLEFKNSLLSDKLDLDYIEILIREKFLYGKKDETLYIIKRNDN
jgi:cell division protein DivIC|tara:strand:- start:35 stop:337 length:303 start_codon:yes stop_codon:yes gene_type:complete